RRQDIPLLSNHFLKREALRIDVTPKKLQSEALQCLISYFWPGNIRELENLIRYLLVVTNEDYIKLEDLQSHLWNRGQGPSGDVNDFASGYGEPSSKMVGRAPASEHGLFGERSWVEIETAYVLYLLQKNNLNITKAARDAGINRSTFVSRMKRLGISKNR
ncbi:MAG: hydrogenase, partial [Thermodesulfobacteriota bacterium]|nr:hydrogenase [Thermodesulfobacteriota bacterium]